MSTQHVHQHSQYPDNYQTWYDDDQDDLGIEEMDVAYPVYELEAGMRTNLETAATAIKYACITALVISVATVFFSLLTAPVGASLLISLLNAPIIAFSLDGILASNAALSLANSPVSIQNQFQELRFFTSEQVWQKFIDKSLASTFLIKYFLPAEGFYASQQSASKAWQEKLNKGFFKHE